jgi:hypothetical protein
MFGPTDNLVRARTRWLSADWSSFIRCWQGMRAAHKTDWLFWLDTFCIPQAPAQAVLRRKAINMMNLVYAAVSQTLILDA